MTGVSIPRSFDDVDFDSTNWKRAGGENGTLGVTGEQYFLKRYENTTAGYQIEYEKMGSGTKQYVVSLYTIVVEDMAGLKASGTELTWSRTFDDMEKAEAIATGLLAFIDREGEYDKQKWSGSFGGVDGEYDRIVEWYNDKDRVIEGKLTKDEFKEFLDSVPYTMGVPNLANISNYERYAAFLSHCDYKVRETEEFMGFVDENELAFDPTEWFRFEEEVSA